MIGTTQPLLGGPTRAAPETWRQHLETVGALPVTTSAILAQLETAGLRGRGGGGFPTARKWRAVIESYRPDATPVVVANGAEGEPASIKDRWLLQCRPHLVLDGLELAARAVGADDCIVYLPPDIGAQAAMAAALRERPLAGLSVSVVVAPSSYIAGEETAAVAVIQGRPARPTGPRPRLFQSGIAGRPTLVNNVETLARAALIARGVPGAADHVLITVYGTVATPGVFEVELGTPLGEILHAAQVPPEPPRALLVGGCFGRWIDGSTAVGVRLGLDIPIGAGVIGVLGTAQCGIAETARILRFLAAESAGQCGPCVHGLAALADGMTSLTRSTTHRADPRLLQRWSAMIAGRGACHHPDGAVALLESAISVFQPEIVEHHQRGRCVRCAAAPLLAGRATRRPQ